MESPATNLDALPAALEGGRLALVPVHRHHAWELFPILSDPQLYHFTGGQPPESLESIERWFANLESRISPDGTQHWLTWVVTLKGTGDSIGYVQATVTGLQADIAWLIGTPWQGQGFAKEAAITMKDWLASQQVERVTAYIHPEHSASQKIASSLGLRRTGAYHDGEEEWGAATGNP